ncbi:MULTISPECIES: hypothetical protein [unclassified Streptomyces]|uniref:hypothetical protein n=1 Tax=unclassified Streptomyces TaxID=2593676 RepID=UPI00336AE136
MPSFEDLYHLKLKSLGESVADWSETIKKLKTLAQDADEGMLAKAKGADWAGKNAGVTKPFIEKTAKEFHDAVTEATSFRNILRDAHDALKIARDDLKGLVHEAGTQGLTISSQGVVDVKPTDSGDSAEPPKGSQAKIDAMVAKIEAVLTKAASVDTEAAWALKTLSGDPYNFSTTKYDSLDSAKKIKKQDAVADAKEAANLAEKLTKERVARNPDDLKALKTLLHEHAQDPDFDVTFYKTLGQEKALAFYAHVSLDSTAMHEKTRLDLVHTIQTDMGTMLGVATDRDTKGHLGPTWIDGMVRAGRKEIDVSDIAGYDKKIYGYQALSSIVRHGDFRDSDLLTAVGRDMVAMDRKDPGVWTRNAPSNMNMALNFDKKGGKGFDPITGLMEAFSHSPDASTRFFNEPVRTDTNGDGIVTKDDKPVTDYDSNYDGKVNGVDKRPMSMVDYILDRSESLDPSDQSTGGEPRPAVRAAGNALEAASTGRVPGDDDAPLMRHTEAMSNVAERIVEKIGHSPELVSGEEPGEPGPLGALSKNFGNIMAGYMADVQMAMENGEKLIKPFGYPAEFDKADLKLFLGAVAQDPQAYGAITQSQQAFTTSLVHDIIQERGRNVLPETIGNAVHSGSEIAGIMAEARTEAIYERHAAENDDFNKAVADNAKWSNRIWDMAGSKYVEMIPVGGDLIQWFKEDTIDAAIERAEKDTFDEAHEEAVRTYTQSETATKKAAERAVLAACKDSGLPQDFINALAGTASTKAGSAYAVGNTGMAPGEHK